MPRFTLSSGAFSRFALALPLVLGACAEERPPINRVQPNALEKSFFAGKNLADASDDPEFYSAATVIDVPYGVDHGLFSGLAGGLKRLKWEITEDRLIARATYETYTGADGRGSRRTNDGQVIAAFPIASHFDIRRSYNPSTGEELNVVEENTLRSALERARVLPRRLVDQSRHLVDLVGPAGAEHDRRRELRCGAARLLRERSGESRRSGIRNERGLLRRDAKGVRDAQRAHDRRLDDADVPLARRARDERTQRNRHVRVERNQGAAVVLESEAAGTEGLSRVRAAPLGWRAHGRVRHFHRGSQGVRQPLRRR